MFIEQPAKWLRWLYPKAIWRMEKDVKALKEYGAKATFFMVGDNVKKHPELYERIVSEGHQVGNHTMNHIGGFRHWTTTYIINTYQANELIHAHLFRPPHGWMRHSPYYWISKYYKVVMWDVVTRDYSKRLTNGSIITFHDSLKSIDKLHYALPEALKWLKEQGYEFRTFK